MRTRSDPKEPLDRENDRILLASLALAALSVAGQVWAVAAYTWDNRLHALYMASVQRDRLRGVHVRHPMPPEPWLLSSGFTDAVGLLALIGAFVALFLAFAAIIRGAPLLGTLLLLVELLLYWLAFGFVS